MRDADEGDEFEDTTHLRHHPPSTRSNINARPGNRHLGKFHVTTLWSNMKVCLFRGNLLFAVIMPITPRHYCRIFLGLCTPALGTLHCQRQGFHG